MSCICVLVKSKEVLSAQERGTERTRWTGLGNKFMQILWCGFMHTVICETDDFVLNPFGDRQPVQRPQDSGDVILRVRSGHIAD